MPILGNLARMLELRANGTVLHCQAVARYAEMIAAAFGFDRRASKRIHLAGLLHDIGKVGVPQHILRKPGPLDSREWEQVRRHPQLGARILASARLGDISRWVLCHHERPDGSGYPAGLTAEEIPLEAKILSVADAFEAMTAARVYSPPTPVPLALRELRRNSGSQFDSQVVEKLIERLVAR